MLGVVKIQTSESVETLKKLLKNACTASEKEILQTIVISKRDGKLFLHQTRVIAIKYTFRTTKRST